MRLPQFKFSSLVQIVFVEESRRAQVHITWSRQCFGGIGSNSSEFLDISGTAKSMGIDHWAVLYCLVVFVCEIEQLGRPLIPWFNQWARRAMKILTLIRKPKQGAESSASLSMVFDRFCVALKHWWIGLEPQAKQPLNLLNRLQFGGSRRTHDRPKNLVWSFEDTSF